MIRRAAVVLVALLASSVAQADGYYTIQEWSGLSEPNRASYIAGAFDSAMTPWANDGPAEYKTHYKRCLFAAKMRDGQLAANVMNFVKNKPELHTGGVPEALMQYLLAACGAPPTK